MAACAHVLDTSSGRFASGLFRIGSFMVLPPELEALRIYLCSRALGAYGEDTLVPPRPHFKSTSNDEQERFILSTLEGLEPRDFVRRRAMDQASLMRAWRGDRLGRLYRETDVAAVRAQFPRRLGKEIFSLE